MVFLDTNIFIYVVSAAAADAPHKRIAMRILAEADFGISVQVLQEFMSVTLRRKDLGLTHRQILEMVNLMITFPMVSSTVSLARHAFELRNKHHISYWDAAILAAALELGCHTLYSEDFTHGRNYDGITVINPFL